MYGKVFLANDVLNQTQAACKIVDLRRKAVKPDELDKPPNEPPRVEVQAFAEQERDIIDVRKKLLREIEILSKLSHVSKTPRSLV